MLAPDLAEIYGVERLRCGVSKRNSFSITKMPLEKPLFFNGRKRQFLHALVDKAWTTLDGT
jgi:hypothetical protein